MKKMIAEIPKNRTETIRISIDEYNSHDMVALRVWFQADDGEMRPGKSGINFRVGLLLQMHEALGRALDEARAAGLVE